MAYKLVHTISLLKHAAMSASYKPALLRAIVRCVQRAADNVYTISLEQLASEFLQMYWSQAVIFHLRHSPRQSAEPEILKRIKAAAEAGGVRELDDLPATTREKLVGDMARVLPINVLEAFHKSKPDAMPLLYTWHSGDRCIKLTRAAVDFVASNADGLCLVANYYWARFLGKVNYAPRIIDKLERDFVRRGSLTGILRQLSELGEQSCFYCGQLFGGNVRPTVDHFIPWTFVFEDKGWNLVLACGECNQRKSDRLADERYLKKLIELNRTRSTGAGPKRVSFLAQGGPPDLQLHELYRAAEASEWPRFWSPT